MALEIPDNQKYRKIPIENWAINDYADFYSFEWGVNVIPADTSNPDKEKRTPKDLDICGKTWKQWKEGMIPIEIHEEWKKRGSFEKYGIAIICGRCWRKTNKIYFCNGIDNDNKLATDELWGPGLEEKTMIEQHIGNLDKSHMFYLSEDRPMKPRNSDEGGLESKGYDTSKIPIIEVQSEGKLMFVSPSPHRDGSNYGIVGTNTILNVPVEQLEKMVDGVCEKYGLRYLKSQTISQNTRIENLKHKTVNTNRQGDLLSIATEYAMRNRGTIDEDDVIHYTGKINQKLGVPYPEERAIEIGISAWKYSQNEEPNIEAEMKVKLKTQWNIIKSDKSTKEEKQTAQKQINNIQEEYGQEKTDWNVSKSKDVIDKTAKSIQDQYHFVTVRKTDEILMYDGTRYSSSSAENIIKENAEDIIEKCTTHERNEVVNKIKAQTGVDIEEFDNDPNLLTLPNGILNIEEMSLAEHSPKNLSRVLLPVEYREPEIPIHDETIFEDLEKNLKDTLFWKFLKSSFTVDGKFRKNNFETILEETASFFVKHQIDEKAFMNHGGGENGKSVYTEFVESLLSRENISKIQIQDLASDKFMCANLEGKLGNIFTDLESDELKKSGKIKSIVSGEGVEVQNKYQKAFTLYPFCKLMFSCNRFPKVYDQSQGFFRKWIIVKWERNFENDPDRDEHLKDKLKNNQEEKNKIFSSLIYLSRKLLRDGKFSHSADWKDTKKEWNSNADPLDDFVSNFIIESDYNKGVRETHQFYKRMMLEKGENPLGIAQFSRAFKEYFDQYTEKDESGKTKRVWLNIDFKEPIDTKMEDYDT